MAARLEHHARVHSLAESGCRPWHEGIVVLAEEIYLIVVSVVLSKTAFFYENSPSLTF